MQVVCKVIGTLGVNCTNEKPRFESVYEDFLSHIETFGYSYGTHEEHNFRFNQFFLNNEKINTMNAEPGTFIVGHNQFSTWTHDEYSKMLGKKSLGNYGMEAFEEELDVSALPATVDWRTKGAVNKIQNQGQCGSCWAFSSIAAMEGAHFLKTGKLVKLAEEQFKDCSHGGNEGCNGGLEQYAFKYAETHKIVLESEYKYVPKQEKCKKSKTAGGVVGVTKYINVKKDSVAQLKAAVAIQPVCIGVEADKDAWQLYKGGILDSKKCGTNVDHAVTAIGYGSESGNEYLLVRNSWGTSWGEKGYIRLAINKDGKGICGSLEGSVYPKTN